MIRLFNVYWRSIVSTLIILGLCAAMMGGYYYVCHTQRETYLREASHAYEKLVQNIEKDTPKIPVDQATLFIQQYANTPYPALLQLQLAQQAISQDQLQKALEWLQAAAKQTKDNDVCCIALQRAARVLAAMNRYEEALKLLESITEKAYAASTEEIQGDILNRLGDKEKALQAYTRAIQSAPELDAIKPVLRMKINDLKHLEKPDSLS